jgi:PadR family transcriptional regulator PadR
MNMAKNDLQGTLGLLVLTTLAQIGALHGYAIVLHIQRASEELLGVEEGSLYPALHRMEESGWIAPQWAHTVTNREAKSYKLAPQGGISCSGRGELCSTGERRAHLVALRVREARDVHFPPYG